MSAPAIETKGLTCYFGKHCVVSDLNLKIKRGSIFGFLGRNGAGKSTTIRMLLGLERPTRGSATVLGHDCLNLPPEARGRIGYLSESHHVYGWMSVGECGWFQRQFYPDWKAKIFHAALSHFRLDLKTKAKDLSRGQRAGLCLALILATEPELLILDDPALGLDPVARRSLIQSMLYVSRRDDRTILFSSHLLSDVERVADHIAILDRGVLMADCNPETFRKAIRQFTFNYEGSAPQLPEIPGLLQSFRLENEMTLAIANCSPATEQALRALPVQKFQEVPLSWEEAFVNYVGERGEKNSFFDEMEEMK